MALNLELAMCSLRAVDDGEFSARRTQHGYECGRAADLDPFECVPHEGIAVTVQRTSGFRPPPLFTE